MGSTTVREGLTSLYNGAVSYGGKHQITTELIIKQLRKSNHSKSISHHVCFGICLKTKNAALFVVFTMRLAIKPSSFLSLLCAIQITTSRRK